MGWSPAFKAALADNQPRMHRVRSLPPPWPGPGGQPANAPRSWVIESGDDGWGVTLAGGSTASASLSIPSCKATMGAWSVNLHGTPSPDLLSRFWKGQQVVHEVRFEGTGWEPVQLGVLDAVQNPRDGEWTLKIRDFLASLEKRYTTRVYAQPLFALYAPDSDYASDYGVNVVPVGAGLLSGSYNGYATSMDVRASTSGGEVYPFARDTEAGHGGLVMMGPDDRETAFYVRYTDVTESGGAVVTLTGCSTGWLGSSPHVCPNWTPVAAVPYIEDELWKLLAKVLTSNGSSFDEPTAPSNGAYDTLPSTWGFGLPLERIDLQDMRAYHDRVCVPASGSLNNWFLWSLDQQDDGFGFIQDWLAEAGFFLTIRQGQITLRGLTNPDGHPAALHQAAPRWGELDPGWLDVFPSWSLWDGSSDVEFARITVQGGESDNPMRVSIDDVVRSNPVGDEALVDLTNRLRPDSVNTLRLVLRLVAQRLAPWFLTLAEQIGASTALPTARGLAVGDMVTISGRDWVVEQLDADWWGDEPTRMLLASPPPAWWLADRDAA